MVRRDAERPPLRGVDKATEEAPGRVLVGFSLSIESISWPSRSTALTFTVTPSHRSSAVAVVAEGEA